MNNRLFGLLLSLAAPLCSAGILNNPDYERCNFETQGIMNAARTYFVFGLKLEVTDVGIPRVNNGLERLARTPRRTANGTNADPAEFAAQYLNDCLRGAGITPQFEHSPQQCLTRSDVPYFLWFAQKESDSADSDIILPRAIALIRQYSRVTMSDQAIRDWGQVYLTDGNESEDYRRAFTASLLNSCWLPTEARAALEAQQQ